MKRCRTQSYPLSFPGRRSSSRRSCSPYHSRCCNLDYPRRTRPATGTPRPPTRRQANGPSRRWFRHALSLLLLRSHPILKQTRRQPDTSPNRSSVASSRPDGSTAGAILSTNSVISKLFRSVRGPIPCTNVLDGRRGCLKARMATWHVRRRSRSLTPLVGGLLVQPSEAPDRGPPRAERSRLSAGDSLSWKRLNLRAPTRTLVSLEARGSVTKARRLGALTRPQEVLCGTPHAFPSHL